MPAPPQSPRPDDTAVANEIASLHRFFERWFRAELPPTDEGFAPLPGALADGFVIVSPTGRLAERSAVLDGVRSAHGTWTESDAIRIESVRIRQRTGEIAVATYEEWQTRGGQERGRLSTAVFDAQLHWLHVHETWLPDGDPS